MIITKIIFNVKNAVTALISRPDVTREEATNYVLNTLKKSEHFNGETYYHDIKIVSVNRYSDYLAAQEVHFTAVIIFEDGSRKETGGNFVVWLEKDEAGKQFIYGEF